MSKDRLNNIGFMIVGILVLILISPLGVALIEHFGKGEFTYIKGIMVFLGIITTAIGMVIGCFITVFAVIAFNRDTSIWNI